MFDGNAESHGSPSQSNDVNNDAVQRYLRQAEEAVSQGDAVLGMHLYLTAFEQASKGAFVPDEAALSGLRSAWELACRAKERSLAEYIFERMEPYMNAEESMRCAEVLQRLALDKLEEFGLSREDIEDMAEMISDDFLGLAGNDGPSVQLASSKVPGVFPAASLFALPKPTARQEGGEQAPAPEGRPADAGQQGQSQEATAEQAEQPAVQRIVYDDLHGFQSAISTMRTLGVGMQNDARYQEFVRMLNERHGIDRVSASSTYLFTCTAREDANQFMHATMGELGLPAVRMSMEEGPQGVPVLCVMASADNHPHWGWGRRPFDAPGVLMLENIDLWAAPMPEDEEDDEFTLQNLSRGAREAINAIRFAVENPDVHVMATAAREEDVPDFFYELLEPVQPIPIELPTMQERIDIWADIERSHPSVRGLDMVELVRLSANMARYDIYMAAQEALEEAYKTSLVRGVYVPVTRDNLFDKLAAYQPLDSPEYRQLEEAVVQGFRGDLDHVDDLLKGGR